MKHGIILVNAYSNHPGEMHRVNRLKEAFLPLNVAIDVVKNGPKLSEIEADFCIFLDKDRYAAMTLEKKMRLFDRAKAIEICDDKMLTHLELSGVVPMPKTIASLLCYTPESPLSTELISCVEETLGYPVVVKECYGSLGRQVYLAKDRKELVSLSQELRSKPHLYQEFIKESAGKDVRVIVVGGKVIGAMKRFSQKDFRSNAELGGMGERYELSKEGRALCEKVANHLKLDYCGIDLLWGKEGMLLCEVNSNAFFQKFEEVTKTDVAGAYARHIYQEIYS